MMKSTLVVRTEAQDVGYCHCLALEPGRRVEGDRGGELITYRVKHLEEFSHLLVDWKSLTSFEDILVLLRVRFQVERVHIPSL